MSFLTPKPTKDGTSSLPAQARRPATSPVFKPEFVRSVRMHPVLAACVALAVCALIMAYALRQKPMYEAESLVYVEPSAVKPLTDDAGGAFDATRYDSYLSQQIQTAGRLDILLAAVHTLPVGTWQMPGESDVSAATRLQNSVKVARVLTSYQLSFTLRGGNAASTATTLNAVVAAYLAAGRKDELAEVDQRAQILGEERQRLSAELAQDRAEQAQLAASLGMANPGAESDNPYDAQLSGLRSELASAREAHDIAAAQLGSVSGADTAHASGLASAADELIAGDAGLSSMRATISQRRATLTGQMAGLKPENPVYRQDQEELADLDRTQDAMTREMRDKAARRLQDKLRTDLARTGEVEARLNGELARQTSLATGAAPRLQRAGELANDIQRLSTRYATVDNNLRSLQLESTGPGLARLALAATPPLAPLPSRRSLMLAAAVPVGLLCGLLAAVFARKRDKRLYIGHDLDETLGFTPIAVLPAPEDVSARAMREYMLRLAGGIESAYRIHGARTFVFTAASRSSGLRSLSTPLAMQLEELGLATTTVSAPEVLHGHFAMETDSGEFKLRVQRAHDAGGRREGVAALNLERLKTTHDLVFVESPPLLTSAETEYLVRSADATILFAESGVTTRGELLQAALLLEQLQVKGIGTVLEGLHLRYADAGFKRALAELESRQAREPEMPAANVARPARMAAEREGVRDVSRQVVVERVPEPQVAERVAAEPIAEEPEPVQVEGRLEVSEAAELPPAIVPPVESAGMLPVTPEVPVVSGPNALAPEAEAMKRNESEALLRIAPERDEAIAPLRTETASRRKQPAEPEPAPARGWLSRLLHRDADQAVSIIPDDDDEDISLEAAPVETAAVPVLPAAREYEIAPAPVMQQEEAAELASAAPSMQQESEVAGEVAPAKAVLRPVRLWEERVGADVPLAAGIAPAEVARQQVAPRPPTHAEPLFGSLSGSPAVFPAPQLPEPRSAARMAVRMEAAPAPVAPVVQTSGVAEPASVNPLQAAPLEAAPVQPAPVQVPPVHVPATQVPPVREAEANEAAPASRAPWRDEQDDPFRSGVFSPGLRTGRWDPIPPLRAQATPWRDRRIPGSDAHVLPQEDRRFRPAATGVHAAAVPPPAHVEPQAPAPVARPQLVQREPRLTRRWGLLSQFAEGEARPQSGLAERQEAQGEDVLGYPGDQRAANGTRRT